MAEVKHTSLHRVTIEGADLEDVMAAFAEYLRGKFDYTIHDLRFEEGWVGRKASLTFIFDDWS